jgi:hypothetical protein
VFANAVDRLSPTAKKCKKLQKSTEEFAKAEDREGKRRGDFGRAPGRGVPKWEDRQVGNENSHYLIT